MKDTADRADWAELLICRTCRRGGEVCADGRRPGEVLHEALSGQALPEGLTLRAVECLQNCEGGCTVALRGADRWTYVYGNLHEADHAEMLADGAARYLATPDGLIPWRERPDHFKKNCIARIPPLEAAK
ncbi:DUF1636 family protein [Poseidonocella sedimentorum]|uniref:Predicted metal-binding protein n=1 Tax=Poseidonocella sedimentorum TaxID=871652 RepID=A0A1I6EKN8_9RHOB|nr:DUF1636 domain-containing protein [Poseidonocella sedimentorum]SFR18078.1 Predicted metal-binding protein [Poseidonocella sedimentorum]